MANLTTRQLKSGEIRVYSGRKKANPKETKFYFREVAEGKKTDPLLNYTEQGNKIIGRIKGGLAQAAKGKRIDGKFISGATVEAAKRKGINLENLIRDSGVKNEKELWKKNPELKKTFDELMSGVGLPQWFNPLKCAELIGYFPGKNITVNGKKLSKNTAKSKTIRMAADIRNHFGNFDASQKMIYIGGELLEIQLPDMEVVNLLTDDMEGMNDFNRIYLEFYQIYGSDKKSKGNETPEEGDKADKSNV